MNDIVHLIKKHYDAMKNMLKSHLTCITSSSSQALSSEISEISEISEKVVEEEKKDFDNPKVCQPKEYNRYDDDDEFYSALKKAYDTGESSDRNDNPMDASMINLIHKTQSQLEDANLQNDSERALRMKIRMLLLIKHRLGTKEAMNATILFQ